MRVADGSSVMGNDIWNLVLSEFLLLNLTELEGGFFAVDLDQGEASLNVQKHAEALAGLGDGDDIHEANREFVVSSDTVINLDVAKISVFDDLQNFLSVQSKLQSASEEH